MQFKAAIFLLHLLFLTCSSTKVGTNRQDECAETRCGGHGPAIRFPFRRRDFQLPQRCSYPGFELSCNENKQTTLKLPFSVEVIVKKIDYKSQAIQVYDPDGCFARQLPNLNLSASPFHFDEGYETDYALFNCSATERELWQLVSCLGVGVPESDYQVYAVESPVSVSYYNLTSCQKMYNTASVPLNIFDQKNTLRLRWLKPYCGKCEDDGKFCRLNVYNSTEESETECFDKPTITNTKGSLKNPLTAGAILGFFSLVIAAMALYQFYSSNKTEKENQIKIEQFLENYRALKPTRYSYADIRRITNQFNDKMGEGGYGTVYKGQLSNEIFVAVKVLNNSKGNGEDFINEVGTIGRIHHVNVVRLVGFCADGFRRALVYEHLPNDSLEKIIFSASSKKKSLGWEKLQDIALGIARGIEYLHQGCDQRILHFDIKPHNILLDHDLNPKISDFGLAKLCSKEQSAVSMTAARGTMGYIAPEVLSRNFGKVSYKSDVYSFGMLLLEMVGGRKNIDLTANNSQVNFPEWIYNRLDQGEELKIRIEEGGDAMIVKKLTIVGLCCIQWYPVDRPCMKDVVQMLEGDGDNMTVPSNPFVAANQTMRKMNADTLGSPLQLELAVIPELE